MEKQKYGKKKESIFEIVVETPAVVLEKTLEETEKLAKKISNDKTIKKAENYWHMLGPGLTTGAADDDPSGITTYSQAGAKYGFTWLWLASFTFPLMAIVQEMCARIGLVTGRGLASNIKNNYPKWVLYICTILLFAANTFNIGADLGAMAKAVQLFSPKISFALLVIAFAMLSLALQIFTAYKKYAKYLKWLALILFSYVFSAFFVKIDWGQIIIYTVAPAFSFSKESVMLITGVLGTTISPYLFFWQTSQEVEEEILIGKNSIKSREGASRKEIKKMRIDIWSGMFLSNLVMFFIIATCAAVLYTNGITNINSAADAAMALKPLAGEGAYFLFALGIIGTGMLAIPVLAGSVSYALSESFNWKEGLYRKLNKAYAFYGIIIISMVLGLVLNFIHLDPIKTLIYSAVGNGIISPIILTLIVLISGNKKIMGEHASRPFTKILGWIITGIMGIAGTATIITFFI